MSLWIVIISHELIHIINKFMYIEVFYTGPKMIDMASYRGVACHIKLEITGYHWLNGYQKIPSSHCSPTVGSFSSLIIIQVIVDPIW